MSYEVWYLDPASDSKRMGVYPIAVANAHFLECYSSDQPGWDVRPDLILPSHRVLSVTSFSQGEQ